MAIDCCQIAAFGRRSASFDYLFLEAAANAAAAAE
jgi:hypothetical protein